MAESLEGEIRTLRALFWSARDPEGRGFAALADAYLRAGDTRQAIELLNEGIDRHPEYVPGHVVAARLYVGRGLCEEGELAARRALDLDPENVDALDSLARALEGLNRTDEARRARTRLAALLPESDEVETRPEHGTVGSTGPAEGGGVGFDDLPDFADPSDAATARTTWLDDLNEPAAAEAGEEVVDLAVLAPEPAAAEAEEEVVDLAGLAPEPAAAEAEEEVVDLAGLAPQPAAAPTLEEPAPEGDDEPVPSIHTRTMAELYARQGLTDRALDVYRRLARAAPDDPEIARRIAELESGVPEEEVETLARDLADSGVGHHDVDTPFAWTHEVADDAESESTDGTTIAAYFDQMLSWEPRGGAEPS